MTDDDEKKAAELIPDDRKDEDVSPPEPEPEERLPEEEPLREGYVRA